MFLRLDIDEHGNFKPGSPVTRAPLFSEYRVEIRVPGACGKPWPQILRCRRSLHNSFCQWYAANEDRFAIKLELLKHAKSCLEIGFVSINRILVAHLVDNGIRVSVVSQAKYWDTILDLDAIPKRVPAGYVCDLCLAEDRAVFPSLEALWRDHVFEPFLVWVNDELAKAEAISVSGIPDWTGLVRLIRAHAAGAR
jgi:hypothetical protein